MEAGPEATVDPQDMATAAATRPSSIALVERDVEAPEVFNTTDEGLWDGRPSLGGVWVAYPDVTSPERVLIRNTTNGQFVIGALFKREREHPGPKLQVSSDAAASLGLLAGKPTTLEVTALRRAAPTPATPEPMATAVEDDATATADAAATEIAGSTDATEPGTAAAATTVATTAAAVEPAAPRKWRFRNPFRRKEAAAPSASDAGVVPASLAAEEITAAPLTAAVEASDTPQPAPQPAKATSLDQPYVQIGIFSVEQNALNTAEALRQNGLAPEVFAQKSSDKAFWRVVIGPAASKSERSTLLRRAKALGFSDAYAVTN